MWEILFKMSRFLLFITLLVGVASAETFIKDSNYDYPPILINGEKELIQLLTLLTDHFTQSIQNDIHKLKQGDNSADNKMTTLESKLRAFSSNICRNFTLIDDKLIRLNTSDAGITRNLETQRAQTNTHLSWIRNDVTSVQGSIRTLSDGINSIGRTAMTDIKLGPRQFNPVYRNNGYHDAYPWIITEVSNWNKDNFADYVGRRQLLKKVDGSWRGMPGEYS